VAYVKASDADTELRFGIVALDDSGATLAVGAFQANGGVTGEQGSMGVIGSGAVCLY